MCVLSFFVFDLFVQCFPCSTGNHHCAKNPGRSMQFTRNGPAKSWTISSHRLVFTRSPVYNWDLFDGRLSEQGALQIANLIGSEGCMVFVPHRGCFHRMWYTWFPIKSGPVYIKNWRGGDKICVIDTEHMIIHIDIYLNTYTFVFV